MTESESLVELRERLCQLEETFLPRDSKNVQQPTPEEVIKILAYRLMAHAEVEDFVESRVEQIATSASRAFDKEGIVSRALLAIASFTEVALGAPPSTLEPEQPTQKKEWPTRLLLAERAKKYVSDFVRTVKGNHGIKEENLLSLVLPVGVPADALDPTWLAHCSSFGSDRGDAAHRSSSRVSSVPNPEDERAKVSRILEGLATLDTELSKLLADVATSDR